MGHGESPGGLKHEFYNEESVHEEHEDHEKIFFYRGLRALLLRRGEQLDSILTG